MSSPINYNDPYLKNDGSIAPIGSVVGGGGGQSGGTNILTGTTIPSNSQGNEGDIYLLIADEMPQSFNITITKALRGDTEQSFFGAQEIQLLFTNGTETKDIIEFSDFSCSGYDTLSYAFNGKTTTGSYWEASGLPGIVNFGATIPLGWEIDKLVIWQRNSSTYSDVWKDFTFSVNGAIVLSEKDLTVNDWAGSGFGTEFDVSSAILKRIKSVYYKVNHGGDVIWIS